MGDPVSVVDMASVVPALERAGARYCELIVSAPDPAQPLPKSEWTVGDTAAHVALGVEAYARYAKGDAEPFVDVGDIAGGSLSRSSAERLDAEDQRDLAVLAARTRAGLAALLEEARGRQSTEPVQWNGVPVTLGAMLGIGLAEVLLHGRDVAKAIDEPWEIAADDARLILIGALPLLPLLVDPAATKGVHASYDLRIRGGPRVTVSIDDGQLQVAEPSGSVDCHVSADPVALLLVAYGRRGQWVPILTGKLVAWGRKPWLGPRFSGYLVAP